ncbi:MAG: hypothetical protein P4L10_17665 [Acidobacteriaceae bacterium]|nr:hypothetical protein [Acidobacteriaceae bacterium]
MVKVERKYYADTEDAYEMMKFFKPTAEAKLMKRVSMPITSTFPGATYPLIEYEIKKEKLIEAPVAAAAAPAAEPQQKKEGGKKKKTKKRK